MKITFELEDEEDTNFTVYGKGALQDINEFDNVIDTLQRLVWEDVYGLTNLDQVKRLYDKYA